MPDAIVQVAGVASLSFQYGGFVNKANVRDGCDHDGDGGR